jgi:hypothetical protein
VRLREVHLYVLMDHGVVFNVDDCGVLAMFIGFGLGLINASDVGVSYQCGTGSAWGYCGLSFLPSRDFCSLYYICRQCIDFVNVLHIRPIDLGGYFKGLCCEDHFHP